MGTGLCPVTPRRARAPPAVPPLLFWGMKNFKKTKFFIPKNGGTFENRYVKGKINVKINPENIKKSKDQKLKKILHGVTA
jgi:hypothetical protein